MFNTFTNFHAFEFLFNFFDWFMMMVRMMSFFWVVMFVEVC